MKTNKIGLIGFGAVGKLLYRTLLEDNYEPEDIYIFDDKIEDFSGSTCHKFDDYRSPEFIFLSFIPTLGYLSSELKLAVLDFLIENNRNIFSYIHPSAYVSSKAKIGKGVLIYSMANIDVGASIGDGCIVANSTIIAHDSNVGKVVYFGANVCVCGEVTIGDMSFIGSSSTISNNLVIGKKCTIGMSSCITKNIPDGYYAIGNPFQLKNKLKLT